MRWLSVAYLCLVEEIGRSQHEGGGKGGLIDANDAYVA